MKNVTAVILGGGAGKRLDPLTRMRAKPAVPLGGKYRLIDIPVSNCINSEVLRIYILTQYNSASLNRHIARTYRFSRFTNGFVEILAAEITPERTDWFQGTADAVRQCLHHLDDKRTDTILILSGDHLYQMDYREFVAHHRETGADLTVSVTAAGEENASEFGLLKTDASGRVTQFLEKPTGEALQGMRVNTACLGLSAAEAAKRPFLASMGIYVFKKEALRKLLRDELIHAVDFGKEVIPGALAGFNVQAYLFDGYWEDIGTIAAFYHANMSMTLPMPPFNFYDAEAPIFSRPRYLPGSKLIDCQVQGSIICDGCILNGATITDSVIGLRSRIGLRSHLEGVLMIGADFYQTALELETDLAQGRPPVGIGKDCHIKRAIIDKDARIGNGVHIINQAGHSEFEGPGYCVRGGIVVVMKGAVIPDGTVI